MTRSNRQRAGTTAGRASARDPGTRRVSVSIRLTCSTARRLRTFVRHHAGHPLYLALGTFVEQAVLTGMARTEGMARKNTDPRHR